MYARDETTWGELRSKVLARDWCGARDLLRHATESQYDAMSNYVHDQLSVLEHPAPLSVQGEDIATLEIGPIPLRVYENLRPHDERARHCRSNEGALEGVGTCILEDGEVFHIPYFPWCALILTNRNGDLFAIDEQLEERSFARIETIRGNPNHMQGVLLEAWEFTSRVRQCDESTPLDDFERFTFQRFVTAQGQLTVRWRGGGEGWGDMTPITLEFPRRPSLASSYV